MNTGVITILNNIFTLIELIKISYLRSLEIFLSQTNLVNQTQWQATIVLRRFVLTGYKHAMKPKE